MSNDKEASFISSGNRNGAVGRIPLTEAQRGVYFECAEHPESTVYNVPFCFLLPEAIDIDRFKSALGQVIEKHPALFCVIRMDAEEPYMVPDACRLAIEHTEAESAEQGKAAFVRPFDLENGPLCRFELCTVPEGTLFLFDVHHLLFDGSSVRIFLDQISLALAGGEIPGEELTLFEEAEREKQLKETPAYKEAQAFFRERFSGTEFETALLSDVDPKAGVQGGGMLTVSCGEELSHDAVENFARRLGVTEATLFTAAFAYTLSVFAGTRESCFITVSAGRFGKPLSRTVGMFVKTLPLRFEIPEDGTVADFLREAQEYFHSTLTGSCISFGELANGYGIRTDLSFVYQGKLISEADIGGFTVQPELLTGNGCQCDLLCMGIKTGTGYEIRSQYRRAKYTDALMQSVMETMVSVLRGFLTQERLNALDLLSQAQQNYISSFNATEKSYDPSETVQAVFMRAAAAYPERTALVYGDRHYSYSAFERITRSLAAYVAGKGIGKDDFVAILTPRDDAGVLAAWGVIRAGAAIEMLDPSYPPERLAYMVQDSGTKLLISDRALASLLPAFDGEILYTDEIAALPDAPAFQVPAFPEAAITLIYTSGTTGKPKGVVLENRNLTAFCRSHLSIMGIDENARVANYASFGFDAGSMDIISTPVAGACLYIVPDEMRLDLERVEAFFTENGITHAFMTTQVGRTFAQETRCGTLKALLVGGEKLVPFTPRESLRFLNGYGPCETMAYICWHRVEDNSPIQPIGRPAENTKLYVLDKLGRLLPAGALGELAISGLQVGRGYLGLPEKTAEVFVPDTYSRAPGYARMYKTGDVVRLLTTGEIEYIGRRDSQVKIRGFRVELTEIEEVIRRFAGIEDATLTAPEAPGGGKYIAAYVVSREKIDTEALNAFIRAEKPAYMVPAVTMQIDAIPYTQNHKVNKRALPAPRRAETAALPPRNDTEKKIFEMTAQVLAHREFGVTTDLFEAGLTSIGTLKLNVQLGKAFGVPVKLSDIKEHPTVEALAVFLAGAETQSAAGRAEDCPLMQNQMGVFIDSNADTETVRYNMPLLMKVSEALDPEALCSAVKKAIDAHPYLKATLTADSNGDVRVCRHDDVPAEAELIRCKELPETDSLVRPFVLLDERLYRAAVYVTETGNYLFLDVHHILADGTSLAVLLRDIDLAYAHSEPEKETYTGFEAALEEQRLMKGEGYAAAEAYYQTLLAGCNTECMPEKCPEPAQGNGSGTFSRTYENSEAIRDFCRRNRFTENAFFNAVFLYTLCEFLHTDDVTYCTVYNGRNDSRLAESVAMLVKTLPIRGTVDFKTSVAAFVSAMQKQLMETMANDIVPFSALSQKYALKPDIFFNYQGDSFTFDRLGGAPAEQIPLPLKDTKAPLSVELFFENGAYRAGMTYDTALFCREFAASFTGALKKAAEEFVRCETLGEVCILSEEEKAHFDAMNDTDVPFEQVPAQTLFERCAAAHPEKTAVITSQASLTYRELEEKANAIANALIRHGAVSGEIVGLIAERSVLVPAAELGILKAGCAFLPMLPSYPDDRLDFCLLDAECRFVIAEKAIVEERPALFAGDKPYTALTVEELLREGAPEKPEVSILLSQPVYCIYTSGSTGRPKGVVIEHHNLSNFVQTGSLRETEAKGDTVLCMASISFDMSVTEIFFSLSLGKTLYIAREEEIHNPDMLLQAFISHKIDIMMATPSFMWSLMSMPGFDTALAQLKSVVLGAEAFQPALLTKLKSLNKDMLVQNGYGPTECTQVCSVKTLTEGGHITIGSPFANMKFYVTDDNAHLLPRYAVGELLIAGENVCRGYVKLPEKNKEAFTEVEGVRAYRSGDLVRINRDNEAEFGGRKDNQVKLRGFRIELDEVEAVMQQYPGLRQSKVVVLNNGTEDFLAGYFTASGTVDVEALSAFMKTKLTYYMVPAAMMQLEKMPLTPNGKLDKKALPEIRPVRKVRAKRAPKKSLEEKIIELFRSVLGTEECYPDDNFFEIGGTSLSASKVVMQLKSAGHKIEYQDIFDHQSAEELAAYLEAQPGPVAAAEPQAQTEKPLYEQEPDIKEVLSHNAMAYAPEVRREPLGDVLLTGAAGFLGVHILKELLGSETGRITCLMRRGRYDSVETRLQAALVYYFENDYKEAFKDRLHVIEGDITDDDLGNALSGVPFDTLINCAASVKHYAKDDSIEFVNVHGVENLIRLTKQKKAKMIQISTTSVPGAHNEETYRVNLRMTEDKLFVIDDMNNQYAQSKYRAELLMLRAIKEGMRGKIIRVGNLMGRYSDGEFQTNMRTNAFLNGLRGFVSIGKCPLSHATDPMNFSPVDSTARAVVLLAGTNDMFTAFHADNRITFDEMKLIDTVNRCGISVTPVPDEEYYADFYRMMGDPGKNAKVSALLTNDRPDVHIVETDNRFTANVLYRLGFSWPFIDDSYLEKIITSLDTMDFFFAE